jgi:BASS family bile acid:Na+ symporter
MRLIVCLSSLIGWGRRNLIWLLVAAFALAAFLPGPGDSLRGTDLGEMPFSGGLLSVTHVLLGVLLFGVGLSIRPGDARELWRIRSSIGWGLAGGWLVPLAALGGMALVAPSILDETTWNAFLIGAAIVVAMPAAHSSSVWSQMSGGPAAATLSVIVLGSLLCPLLTPIVLAAVTASSGDVTLRSAELIGSLEVLIAFVVLPAAVGVALRGLLEALCGARSAPVLTLAQGASLLALLVLNYANASAAQVRLIAEHYPVESVLVSLMTVLMCAAVFVVAVLSSRALYGTSSGRRLSFVYVTGMKNTGAGLVLATSVLNVAPLAMLVPVLYTISQHLAAAIVDRLLRTPPPVATAEPCRGACPQSVHVQA